MVRTKRSNEGEFSDILAALEQNLSKEASPVATRRAGESAGAEIQSEVESRRKNRLRRLLKNISFPWPSGIGAFGARAVGSYVEEKAADVKAPAQTAVEPPVSEIPKTEVAKTEDEAIAEELGLNADLASVELRRIRRDFAKKNHPDRFEPALRTGAARRMSIANMLIDAHLKQSRSGR